MKKILATVFFLCFVVMGMLAKTNRELVIRSTNKHLMPRSVVEIPKVYQSDSFINITMLEAASHITVSVIDKSTGEQVYTMVYLMSRNLQIDLSGQDDGEYSIIFSVDGVEYTGDFVL